MRRVADDRVLFALLRVDESASWAEVRSAFREAVRANHPDLHPGDEDAGRRLSELNAAWEAVNTPVKWDAYVRRPPGVPPGTAAVTEARVRVHRQQQGSAGLLNWWLELDGEAVTSIHNGGAALIDATPGRHALRVFYGTRSSLPLEVELRPGEELVLGCRQLESLRAGLFSPKRSLVLEPIDRRPLH